MALPPDAQGADAAGEPPGAGAPFRTVEERRRWGRACRKRVPRRSHGEWSAPVGRADPIALLEESSRVRISDLVPIRYGRMLASPFAFLRGSPVVMARDLASTPVTGMRVQACGDAHLQNFGLFATPERHLVFGLNDFDETLPGPWEWDIKRLATSVQVFAQDHGLDEDQARRAVLWCAESYRAGIRAYATMGHLGVWYARIDVDSLGGQLRGWQRQVQRGAAKARRRTSWRAMAHLCTTVDGTIRIREDPPLVTHMELGDEFFATAFESYLTSVHDEVRHLLGRYRYVDFAHKVVGLGSVGTRCYVALFEGAHDADPLVLQIKEADPSVLERYVGASSHAHHGQRVVSGQRLIQAAPDLFLGWATGKQGFHYYFRQLWDMKGSIDADRVSPSVLRDYAGLCGWALAKAHARSGDAVAIGAYLGGGDRFDRAVAEFAAAYALQNEQDHRRLVAAAATGRLGVTSGV